MGRRRRKVEAELIELFRAELTSIRTEMQTALADTAAVLSARVRSELEQRMGEPSALASGIQEHVKQNLAHYKYPRWVEFVAELPKTATGKIQRYKLRAAR